MSKTNQNTTNYNEVGYEATMHKFQETSNKLHKKSVEIKESKESKEPKNRKEQLLKNFQKAYKKMEEAIAVVEGNKTGESKKLTNTNNKESIAAQLIKRQRNKPQQKMR